MKELISTIQSLIGKVEDGKITQAEMEQLVADARELNERLIVLRYKVYEQGIFELNPIQEPEAEVELPEFELNLEMSDEQQNININEALEREGSEEFDEEKALSETLNNMLDDLSKEELEDTIDQSQGSFQQEDSNQSNSDLFTSGTNLDEPNMGLKFNETEENEHIIEESTIITSTFDQDNNIETQEISRHQTSVVETDETTTIIETEETTMVTIVENQVQEDGALTEKVISEAETNEGSMSELSIENSELLDKLKTIEKSIRINYSIVPQSCCRIIRITLHFILINDFLLKFQLLFRLLNFMLV